MGRRDTSVQILKLKIGQQSGRTMLLIRLFSMDTLMLQCWISQSLRTGNKQVERNLWLNWAIIKKVWLFSSYLDCLDLADSNYHIVGKLLYEIVWRQGGSQIPSMPEGRVTFNLGVNPYYQASLSNIESKPSAKNIGSYSPQNKNKPNPEKQKKQKKKDGTSGFASMFCCFGTAHQRPQMKKIKFAV